MMTRLVEMGMGKREREEKKRNRSWGSCNRGWKYKKRIRKWGFM